MNTDATTSQAIAHYAVIRTGGQQIRVSPGDKIKIHKLTAEPGSKVTMSEVLLVKPDGAQAILGSPLVKNASVEAKVLKHFRDKKVVVYRKIRRKGFTKKRGHRQEMTEVLIESINS